MKTGTTIESTSVIDDNDAEVLEVELRGVAAISVNKPPGNAFQMHTLLTSKPKMIIGDFNSHSINWGYSESNLDGEAVKSWARASHLSLLYHAKLSKSFNSEKWKQEYHPDLAFVSHSIPPDCKKMVLEPIPKTQHRPIGIIVTSAVSTVSIPKRGRFNLKKAN